jgi:hypothetical protein
LNSEEFFPRLASFSPDFVFGGVVMKEDSLFKVGSVSNVKLVYRRRVENIYNECIHKKRVNIAVDPSGF